MSKIDFVREFNILRNGRTRIPEEFWRRTPSGKWEVIWLVDRQKPSVDQSYDFDQERFGLTREGEVIWGFHSGCS